MRKMFVETDDFNCLLVTDGDTAWAIPDFPDDGDMSEALLYDTSSIDGCEDFEDIERFMGFGIYMFPFCEEDYNYAVCVGTL